MNNKAVKVNKKLVRKEADKIRHNLANEMIIELFNAPFKYRLKFALKILRGKKGILK